MIAAQEPRYERKFVISAAHEARLEAALRRHPACFVEHYPPRWVHNLYSDTEDFRSYREALAGVSHRLKVRLRWYDEAAATACYELKRKQGVLGTKQRFAQDAKAGELKRALQGRRPTLRNAYRRRYFENAARDLRLTVDTALQFWRPGGRGAARRPGLIIVELKYAADAEAQARDAAAALPMRLARFSKYVEGLKATR